MAQLMKTIQFSRVNKFHDTLRIVTDGCVVTIRVNLDEAQGTTRTTAIMIEPEEGWTLAGPTVTKVIHPE
jgi:hypothetical protein